MLINKTNLAALNVEINDAYNRVIKDVPAWSDRVATQVTSKSAVNIYPFVMNAFKIREWKGTRTSRALEAYSYSLPNIPFESTLEVRREDILDDALGLLSAAIVPGFARKVRKHPDALLVEKVFTANPNAFDGQAFWSSAHPTFFEGGTYDNDVSADATTLDSLADDLMTIRATMKGIVDESGEVIGVEPRALIVPPQQEYRFRKLIESSVLPEGANGATVDNVLKGVFTDLVVIDELVGTPNTVYMADLTNAVKPFIDQIRSEPILRQNTDGLDNDAFDRNVFRWGLDGADGGPYRRNVGVTLPFLCFRIALTGL